jgi:hypothetical protein
VIRDVLVERATRDELVVISRHAGVVGEALGMELGDNAKGAFSVQVMESRPVVSDAVVRHRLLLRPSGVLPVLGSPMAPWLAVLTRELPVRVLNCSSSGCLLESAGPMKIGTVASLRLVLEREELADQLQVVRCQPIEGGSTYHAGAEFLWTVAPTRQSLRVGIGQHASQHPKALISLRAD